MAATLATVLAFYSDGATAARALRQLRRGGFRRSAAIQHGQSGKIVVRDNDISPRLGAALGFAVALGTLAGYFSLMLMPSPQAAVQWVRWATAALLAMAGAGVGWLAARWLDFGVENQVLARYRRWVMPRETLLLVQTPVSRGPDVQALLRRVEGVPPATFVLRSLHRFPAAAPAMAGGLRLERFTPERLNQHVTRLAAGQQIERARRRGRPLWNRLRASERTLRVINSGLAESVRLEESISLAAEWLLDNGYVVRRHIGDVRRNLSRRLYDVLPVLQGHMYDGQPRIYALAFEFVSHTDAEVHAPDLVDFLQAYQETTPLTIGELWAMPLMLRLALIENLSRLAVEIDRRQHEHERADLWANRLLTAARRDVDHLLFILAELAREQPNPPPYFADRLVSQLQGEAIALDPIRNWLERKLGAPVPEVIQHEQLRHAADQVTVANAISSLRRLARVDWREVFEQVSLVHRILGDDPAEVYSEMDFGTRDRYRHAVEEIARGAKLPEVEVARTAVAASSEFRVPSSESRLSNSELLRSHVGYVLIGEGRADLERRTRCRPAMSRRIGRWVHTHPALVYVGGIAAVTAGGLLGVVALAGQLGVAAPVLAVLAVLALLPVSEVAIQIVNYVVTRLLEPRVLPKLSFEEGIPDEWRTLVVVPTLLLSTEEVREDLERLEIRFLANQDPNLSYALLADFPDAPQPVMPEDASLLDAAVRGVEQLNARYSGNRFSLLYRQRQWSVTEQVWMGWERKRGKLEELNRLLVGSSAARSEFRVPSSASEQSLTRNSELETRNFQPGTLQHVGDPSRLAGVRFVITLDSDTQLPYGAARRMIETLAHPLNRPGIAPDGQTVAAGYTIIQPRVSTTLPSATATRFSRRFTDPVGTDPYTQAVSDVYQDLAGEGSYHGKGIYDVQAFRRVLDGRFPDALLLSHDLLEGAHVRVGLATDIELFDLFPSSYLAYSRRAHRWIRGDWQIADWCMTRVPGGPRGGGRPARNPISAFNRWKIFDNLRRSLVPAST
ncbi:MAG: glycosyl transferase, partial [Chloroflexota bacterium]